MTIQGNNQTLKDILLIALEDVEKCFGIKENLYETYCKNELLESEDISDLIFLRHKETDWSDETPLGGPGTTLNAIVLYCLIRHYGIENVLETGVSGGFYSCFLLAALSKHTKGGPPFLTSIELSDDKTKVAKLVPFSLGRCIDWELVLGRDSIEFMRSDVRSVKSHELFCHDSLHTMSHMLKELMCFKECEKDRFFIFIDDQNSENFWDKCLQIGAFNKPGYSVKYISGKESRLKEHMGGIIKYERLA